MTISLSEITKIYILFILLFELNRCRDLPKNMNSGWNHLTNHSTRRVVAGKPVQLGEVPYQVGFKKNVDRSSVPKYYTFCGGSIIGATKLLSAAHCFVDEKYSYFIFRENLLKNMDNTYAVAASLRNIVYKREDYEQWRPLLNITYPRAYNFPDHDIAILFVKEPFVFNDFVKPIDIATWLIDYDGTCMVSGYGEISNMIISDSLLKADLVMLPSKKCSRLLPRRNMKITVCTLQTVSDIGRGDSGGPLVYTSPVLPLGGTEAKRTLIGIASGTHQGIGSLFVRVSAYHKFIERNRCEKPTRTCYFVFNLILLKYYIVLREEAVSVHPRSPNSFLQLFAGNKLQEAVGAAPQTTQQIRDDILLRRIAVKPSTCASANIPDALQQFGNPTKSWTRIGHAKQGIKFS